jgi:hypothetical protein
MPVVLRVGGFAFSIYPGDHDPPHVHVRYSGTRAVVDIESEQVRDSRGMTTPDVAEAQRLVRMHRAELLANWINLRLPREP